MSVIARKGQLVSITNRKILISGGQKDVDYRVDAHNHGIYLLTADNDVLTKGKRYVIMLVTKVQPKDRISFVKINNELYKHAVVSGTRYIEPEDTGEVVLNITPRKDLNLNELSYICKVLVEGGQ